MKKEIKLVRKDSSLANAIYDIIFEEVRLGKGWLFVHRDMYNELTKMEEAVCFAETPYWMAGNEWVFIRHIKLTFKSGFIENGNLHVLPNSFWHASFCAAEDPENLIFLKFED